MTQSPKKMAYALKNPLETFSRAVDMLRFGFLYLKYRGRPHREFYSEVMKIRTRRGPRFAVGGLWDQVGTLQFEFLRKQGLKPQHSLLDIGCGSLRGGLRFIAYLDPGNYYGIDINPDILEAGRRELRKASLEHKRPTIRVNADLNFDDFGGARFDFILALAVFTHMPPKDIEICLKNLHKVMAPGAIFFATYYDSPAVKASFARLNFYYTFEALKDMGAANGLKVEPVPDFVHPRGQKMIKTSLLIP